MKLNRFTVKDIVFIAILSAAITLSGLITMPLVMSVTLFGVRNMASAFLYALFVAIGLLKVRKIGTLTLIGLLHGSVLLMMAPVMFWSMFIGALLTELLTLMLFKSYEKEKAIAFSAVTFIPMTLPFTLIFSMLIHGKTFESLVEKPLLSLGICALTLLLSYLGTALGLKMGKELKKAGKL